MTAHPARPLNKLTLVLLFCIFVGVPAFSVPAQEGGGQINDRVLLARSYQPDLVYEIFLRSTGHAYPRPLQAPPTPRILSLPGPDLQPLHLPSSPSFAPPAPAPLDLHSRVLKQLQPYEKQIRRYSGMQGVDPNLVRALIYVESAGDPNAVSSKGAQGLMQLMPNTARDMGVSNPFDPAQNIFGGTRYISALLGQFDRLDLALWAYNAGPDAVAHKRLPLETRRFVPKVIRIKSLLDRSGS